VNAEFLEPTPASRRKLTALLVAALAGGASLIEWLKSYLAELKSRPICDTLEPVLVLGILILASLLLLSAWVAWTARKVLRLDQWPLPGTWVFRRTPIQRGRKVVLRAYAMLGLAVLVVAFVAFASYGSWQQLLHGWVLACGIGTGTCTSGTTR